LFYNSNIIEKLEKSECPLFSKNIRLKQIGKGKYGNVYDVYSNNKKTKYVVKEFNENFILEDTEPNNKNKYILNNPIHAEYLLSLYMSSLNKPYFLKIYGFKKCDEVKYNKGFFTSIKHEFIFMDRVDTDLRTLKYYNNINEEQIFSIFFQVLNGIITYQKHKITHNDLTPANIFLVKGELERDKYIFKFTKNNKWIAKIGDWGFGIKTSKPMIVYRGIKEGFFEYLPEKQSYVYDFYKFLVYFMIDFRNYKCIKIICELLCDRIKGFKDIINNNKDINKKVYDISFENNYSIKDFIKEELIKNVFK